jgi:hypothetical protein
MAAMLVRFRHLFGWLTGVFRSPADLILENRALRQQLLALHAQRPREYYDSKVVAFATILSSGP